MDTLNSKLTDMTDHCTNLTRQLVEMTVHYATLENNQTQERIKIVNEIAALPSPHSHAPVEQKLINICLQLRLLLEH